MNTNKAYITLFLLPLICSVTNTWQPVTGQHFPGKFTETITYHGNFAPRPSSFGSGASVLGSSLGHSTLGGLEGHSLLQAGSLPESGFEHAGSHLLSSYDSGSSSGGSAGLLHPGNDQCGNYKVGFTQDLYFQYIQFKHPVPELKEFTLCMWTKFTNHSNDHPLFSYAVDGQPRAILIWISNTDRSSYFSMSVTGHTFYRLNYPIRLNRWYHSCHSWNGRTGEWQLWVNGERVGRGFHNRLVGQTIPGGGVAISGQEQRQVGGGFLEGQGAPKGSGGMLGEVTLVQLYSVALTAGKAHKDHKHHHAHTFLHEGVTTTTTTPRPAARVNQPMHPLLTGGQINPNLNLNFAGGQPTPAPQPQIIPSQFNGQPINSQLLNGQFLGRLVSEQLISSAQANPANGGLTNGLLQPATHPQLLQAVQQQQQQQFSQPAPQPSNQLVNSGLVHPQLVNPANVQFIDTTAGHQFLYKRDSSSGVKAKPAKVIVKRGLGEHGRVPLRTENKHNKRGLVLVGDQLFEDTALSGQPIDLVNGLASIGENQPVLQQQKASEEREPAEAEVQAVMAVCTGCDEEPFEKALVFGWRTVPKKLYSGAFYTPAIPECKAF